MLQRNLAFSRFELLFALLRFSWILESFIKYQLEWSSALGGADFTILVLSESVLNTSSGADVVLVVFLAFEDVCVVHGFDYWNDGTP